MADFDEKVGMDVIKDSMGLTDSDLSPQGDTSDDFDTGSDFDDSPGSTFDGDRSDAGRASDRASSAPGMAPTAQPARRDPLREPPLRFDPSATFVQNKRGDLVDARTKEVIARAGSEARIYQRVHKEASDYVQKAVNGFRGQMMSERGKLERAVELGLGFERQASELKGTLNQINAHQLDTDQLLEAAQYYKQAQTDPIGVLKNLLTRAAIMGVDVSQLGVPGATSDMSAVVDMVRREIQAGLGPVNQYTNQRQQEQQDRNVQQQYMRQAERQVGEFFARTPEAGPYTHVFHAVLSQPQFRNMTLGQIWDKLQLHLIRSGVDPRTGQRQRSAQPTNGSTRTQRSLPNGRGMAPSGSDRGRPGNAGPAHPGMSYDAIIREILGPSPR
jgi:hypothetical protein